MIMARTSIVAAGRMQSAFTIQIAYALFTLLIAALVIDYPGYDLVASGIRLKGGLIDYFIFFLVFLFGLRTTEDALTVIKWLLFGAVFANAATILDAFGAINLGYRERLDGRTQGAIGESNQYAAFIILFIPGMVAAAVGSAGFKRLLWLGGALLSCAALVMTASRGGLVGAIFGLAVGAWLYRHLVSYSRAAGWVLGTVVVFVVVMSFSQYGGLLTERVFGQTANIDVTEASSGRTEIWFNLFASMAQAPVTFITGYGWNVYWSMPFRFSPHNHYFSLWFNLGLVGLVSGTYLLFSAVGRAWRASLEADAQARRQLVAYVIGATSVCAAIFFVELHDPWMYFWMYTGAVMRMALCVQPATAPQVAPVRRRLIRNTGVVRDAYGWSTTQGRKGA